jgi:hypothetical protein
MTRRAPPNKSRSIFLSALSILNIDMTFSEIERPMSFTVHGKNPYGGHLEFARITAAGAVFKAADLVGDGWTGVHISDANNKIYWPARFNRISDRFKRIDVVSKPECLMA